MDPLEKRYNDPLENPQQHRDAGEISDAPQGDLKPWHDPGLAEDVSRSIERVQQQEHWLQGQANSNLLNYDEATSGHPTADGLAQGRGERQLWVVDSSASNWQERVDALGPGDDLLLLEASDQGLERISQSLQGQNYTQINLLPGGAGEAGDQLLLGSDRLPSGDISAAQRQQLSEWSKAVAGGCSINCMPTPGQAVRTRYFQAARLRATSAPLASSLRRCWRAGQYSLVT